MKQFSLEPFRLPTKIIWCLMMLITLAIAALSIYSVLTLPGSGLAVLGSSMIVAAFANHFRVRLPGTQVVVPTPIIFAVWGMFWLGPGGAVSLGIVCLGVDYYCNRREDPMGLFSVFTGVAALAASVSLVLIGIGIESDPAAVASGLTLEAAKNVLVECGIMSSTYFAATALLNFIFYKLESDLSSSTLFRRLVLQASVSHCIAAAGGVGICLMFANFGIGFGFVIAPLAIFTNLAYRIHISRLEQKTSEISEASRIHLATVEALATAIDARGQVGLGHVRRAQIYAVGIGQVLGLSDDEISALRTGALLHDIGKLAVPDHILNKPGDLTAAELEKTKIHSTVGASILEKVGFQYPVVPTVKYHHECWDGNGYPDRLKGEQIPLTARILAVADAYDTLRGARPYRPPVPREKARKIIQEGAGTKYDPNIVRAFIKNLFIFEAEIEKHGLRYGADNGIEESNRSSGVETFVEQIKLANREVFTLYELAREFSSSISLNETVELFTKRVGEFVPFETCAVYLLDAGARAATAIRVDGEHSRTLASRQIRVGQGATGVALKKLETIQNVDPGLDFTVSNVELAQYYSTMASVPLIADDQLIGAISIYSCEYQSYGEEHIRLLETIARMAADAIGKSLQHDEAKAHAMTDPMTGLPNARSLQIQFDKEVGRSSRTGSDFQLLMLDLDGFKAVNDNYGHKAGDKLLKEIGEVIRGQLRDYDFLARYGGDEFVALIPEANPDAVKDLCDRIERAVSDYKLPVRDGEYASVGVSLGASGYPRSGETFDQMVIAADKIMYERKTTRKRANLLKNPTAATPPADSRESRHLESQVEAPMPLDRISKDNFIVELDESHVIQSSAIN